MDNPSLNPRETLISVLLFLTAFGFALAGLNPTFYADDSPETITACVLLGIPHPPGYPLPTLAGHLFSLLPLSHYPLRVNLLSALLGAGVCSAIYLFLTRSLAVSRLLAFFFSLLWIGGATSYPAALSAKTGLYELTALFLLGILGALLAGRFIVASFLFGLSCTGHWMSMAAYLPGFLLLAYFRAKERAPEILETVEAPAVSPLNHADPVSLESAPKEQDLPGKPAPFDLSRLILEHSKELMMGTSFLLVGLSVYLYLPIRAQFNPSLNWGDPSSWGRFASNFLRREYGAGEAAGGAETWFTQGWFYLRGAFFEYDGLLLAALWGMGMVYFQDKKKCLGLGSVWLSLVGAMALYLHLPKEQMFLIADYTLSANIFILLFAAWGVESLFSDWTASKRDVGRKTVAAVLALVLPILCFGRNVHSGQNRYTFIHDYALNALKGVPRDALYFTQGDGMVFPLWYFQSVEGKRADVVHVGEDGFPMEWVRRKLYESHPGLKVPLSEKPLGPEAVAPLMAWTVQQNPGREVYSSHDPTAEGRLTGTRLVPYGVSMKGFLPGQNPVLEESRSRALWDGMRLRNLGEGAYSVDPRTDLVAVGRYAAFRNSLGTYYEDQADTLAAAPAPGGGAVLAAACYQKSREQFTYAERWEPTNALYLCNLGNSLFHLGRLQEASEWYGKAVDQDPQYLSALYNWAVAEFQLAHYPKAGKLFDRVLELKPDYPEARNALNWMLQQRQYSR